MNEEGKEPLEREDPQAEREAERETEEAVQHAVGEALPLAELPLAQDRLQDVEEERAAAETVEPVISKPETVEPVEMSGERLVLERKHPLAIRWMHWINFPVLFVMMWSGLLIYWNDSIPAGQGRVDASRVYRVGIGSWTWFRLFPDWFYNWLHVPFQVTKGLGYHFLFMWIFAINGILYAIYLLWSKEWKFMVPNRDSLREAIQVTLVDLHLRKGLPVQTKYNGAQRIAYTVTVLMGLGSLVTGLSIYKPTQAHWITTLLGGYEMARWEHFWLTMGFCAFFLLHVVQVILAGWNNFRAMVSGYELRRADAPPIEAERRRF